MPYQTAAERIYEAICPRCLSKAARCDDYAWPAFDYVRSITFQCPDCDLRLSLHLGGIPGQKRQHQINERFKMDQVKDCEPKPAESEKPEQTGAPAASSEAPYMDGPSWSLHWMD